MSKIENLKDEVLIDKYYGLEYSIDDMMNIRNLQENFDDEQYQSKIDKMREERKKYMAELKRRGLDSWLVYCQADLYF